MFETGQSKLEHRKRGVCKCARLIEQGNNPRDVMALINIYMGLEIINMKYSNNGEQQQKNTKQLSVTKRRTLGQLEWLVGFVCFGKRIQSG